MVAKYVERNYPAKDEVLIAWRSRMRHHMIQATKSARAWEDKKAELVEYVRVNNYTRAQARTLFTENWDLKDCMDGWSWHEREAKRFADAIQAEMAMQHLGRDDE